MMNKEYRYEPFDERDIHDVAHLQIFHWGGRPVENVRHLKWKYYVNPLSQGPIACTVKKGSSTVGFMGLIPTRWKSEGGHMDFLSFADSCIHPDHRGKGLYPGLINSLIEQVQGKNYEGFLNLSNNEITSHVMAKMGFRSLMKRIYLKRIRYFSLLKNMLLDYSIKEYSYGDVSLSLSPDIDGMIWLDERIQVEEKIELFKGRPFYQWRFGSNKRKYHFMYKRIDGNVVAYLIILVNKTGTSRIVDFAYKDVKFLMDIIRILIKRNNYSIILYLDANLEERLSSGLSMNGFCKKHPHNVLFREKGISYLSLRTLDGTEPSQKLKDIKNWKIKEIASDGV